MPTFTNITKILKQSLKTQKATPQLRNKLAFNIFQVAPDFVNNLITLKIAKNSCGQERSLSLNV